MCVISWQRYHLVLDLVHKLYVVLFTLILQGDGHPITPVMLGDARLAVEFADEMLGMC